MPGIVNRSVPAEVTRVVSDQSALLPDLGRVANVVEIAEQRAPVM